VLPPYTFPTPSIEIVLQALGGDSLAVARERIAETRRERDKLSEALLALDNVLEVYPSQANFLLVRLQDRDAFAAAAHRGGILVRSFSADPLLADCIRITIGLPEDNARLLRAVAEGNATR
jgi:histidinol-phosphate aminotransferase